MANTNDHAPLNDILVKLTPEDVAEMIKGGLRHQGTEFIDLCKKYRCLHFLAEAIVYSNEADDAPSEAILRTVGQTLLVLRKVSLRKT